MMRENKKTLFLSLISVLLVLLIVVLAIYSTAYFGTRRKLTGRVYLTPGILVDFGETVMQDETTSEFWLLKHDISSLDDVMSVPTKSKINETNFGSHEKIFIVNPTFESLTTDEFYIRAKIILKHASTNTVLTDEELDGTFNTRTPITFSDDWLFDGEWAYYVGNLNAWTNVSETANAEDLKVVSKNDVVSFLAVETYSENDVEFTYQTLSFKEDLEHFPIIDLDITLLTQAVEIAKVNEAFFS